MYFNKNVRNEDMIYLCTHCQFEFSRVGETDVCPNCGKDFVREAKKDEQTKYQINEKKTESS